MTRAKVDPEKRQRTANACDSCKRRKQKCNGQQPCNTCGKRNFECTYVVGDNQQDGSPPSRSSRPKRLNRGADVTGIGEVSSGQNAPAGAHMSDDTQNYNTHALGGNTPSIESAARAIGIFPAKQNMRPQNDNSADEEAENHTTARMIADDNGRFLYVGEAATLTFLQILRTIVETTVGECPFTTDPARHHIAETRLKLPSDVHLTHQLPPKQIALILVDAFFIHLHGIVEIFDERDFLKGLHKYYSDPLSPDHIYLCHLNLVLAIGISFATPEVGSTEAVIVDNLRSKFPDQAEVFYLHAKSLSDPFVGFEDGDVWTIQALLLTALFMVTKSKRNAAAACVGMAVRTAYALGLHREGAVNIFPRQEALTRRKLWRSLFILDRFLASALGRPVAIAEEECSGEILNPISRAFSHEPQLPPEQYCTAGLEAACRSCHVIGLILRKVYLQRKISTKLAQELADECKTWPENLSPSLHWRQASPRNRRQAIAILHANTIYCHSIILLSRPFFLYLLTTEIHRTRLGNDQAPQPRGGRMEQFSRACLVASSHTIAIIQNAYDGRYLPKVEPFVTYSLFAAALIISANEFVYPSSSPLSNQAMANAITIMSYCGEMDPQAKKSAQVLMDFRDVIVRQRRQPSSLVQPSYNNEDRFENAGQSFDNPNPAAFAPVLDQGWLSLPPLPGATKSSSGGSNTAHSAPPNLFDKPSMGHPPLAPDEQSFSGLLDLTNTVLPSDSNPPSAAADEAIDFDSIWGPWSSDPNYSMDFGDRQNGDSAIGSDNHGDPGVLYQRA